MESRVGAEGLQSDLSVPTGMVDGAPEDQPETPLSPTVTVSAGHMAGGHRSGGVTMEDVIDFGGIPDPASGDRRFSHWIQSQPDAVTYRWGVR